MFSQASHSCITPPCIFGNPNMTITPASPHLRALPLHQLRRHGNRDNKVINHDPKNRRPPNKSSAGRVAETWLRNRPRDQTKGRSSGSLLNTEMKVDSVFSDKEFHQSSQFGRQGLGEAGTPAAREPVQRCQPCPHRAQQAWPAAAHWQTQGPAFFPASGGSPDCATALAGLPATSKRQRHSTPAPNDGESPGHCAP